MSYIGRLAKGSLLVGTGLGNVELPVGADGASLQADSAQTNGVKWQVPAGHVTQWINNTAVTSVNLAVNTGYIHNNPSNNISYTLPATAAVGSVIRIVKGPNSGIGTWQIIQGSGQSIYFGNIITTVGGSGTLYGTVMGDAVELLCTVADTTWTVISSVGNLGYA